MNPNSVASCRRRPRTRLNICPPCFSSTSEISWNPISSVKSSIFSNPARLLLGANPAVATAVFPPSCSASAVSVTAACSGMRRASIPIAAAISRNATFGIPGTAAITTRTPHTIHNEFRRSNSCVFSSVSSCPADDARVSTIAPATVTSRLGIIVTSPSPTVRMVYVFTAVIRSVPCCSTPMASPAIILIAVIRIVASESLWLNFAAPSIAP